MKIVGYILVAVGGLNVFRVLNDGMRFYDLNNRHDLSKFAGGLGVSLLIVVWGLSMAKKSS